MQINKEKVISYFGAILIGVVLTGIVAASSGEKFGYTTVFSFLYGLLGYSKATKELYKRIKK